jgi:hypothetical protein
LSNLFNLIAIGAAASFAALLLNRKNGPLNCFVWLRTHKPFSCLFCGTFWFALLFYAAFCYNGNVTPDIVEFLAACGIGVYLSHGTYVEPD